MTDLFDELTEEQVEDLALQAKVDAFNRLQDIQKLVKRNEAKAKKQAVKMFKVPNPHELNPRFWLNFKDQQRHVKGEELREVGLIKLLGGEAVTRTMMSAFK